MKKTETTMAEAVSEEIATEVPTVEDLQAECKSIHEQNELLQKQYINLQDRYSSEKDSWKKYRRDMLAENEALREHCMNLEHRVDKLQKAAEQERGRLVATAPKLVIISAAAGVILLLIFLCMRKPSTRILSGLAEHLSEIELEARAEERAEAKKAEEEADKIRHEQKAQAKKQHNKAE